MSHRLVAVVAAGLFFAAAPTQEQAQVTTNRAFIDAHVHVWTPDTARYPLAAGFKKENMRPASFTPEELFAHCKPAGVGRINLIQMSFYGFDNSYMLDAIAKYPDVFVGTAVINPHGADPARAMAELAQKGVRAFRIHPRLGDQPIDTWLRPEGYKKMFAAAARNHQALACLIGPDGLPELDRMCTEYPDTPVIIDHLSRIGADGVIRAGDVDRLCAMARHKNVLIKVGAFYALGKKKPPYDDLMPLIEKVVKAFRPQRCMWESDSPFQVQGEHTYQASIDLIHRLPFLSADDKDWLLRKTAETFFFAPRSRETPPLELPDTISPLARMYLQALPAVASLPAIPAADDRAGWKKAWEAGEAASEPKVQATLKRYEPTVTERKIGGVPVLDVKPKGYKESAKVLVHLHGGCYTMFSAHSRLPSSVTAAHATGLRVLSVDYTLAPQGKWQQVIDEVLAVIAGLQKDGHPLKDIAIYGESAGGAMAAGAVLKMRDQGLGMPAALVLWSPWSDITNRGDSAITLRNFDTLYVYEKHLKPAADAYADPKDQKHPWVSPVYGDYTKGFPPTLIQGGTREIFLSHFIRQYRAIDDAGGTAVLDLYDGMPHIFQVRPELADAPETKTALKKMTAFLSRHLRD